MAYLPQKQSNHCSPKAVVLREEFVALTHDPLIAIVLNQLLYWTQRVKDFDLFLKEEQFFKPECDVFARHGWLYKTANDLIIESMICVDRTTMRRYLKFLIDQGWLEERTHPKNKWDKTSQYRLNLRKLQGDLSKLGFELPGIELFLQNEFIHKSDEEDLNSDHSKLAAIPNGDFALSNGQNTLLRGKHLIQLSKVQEISNGQNPPSKGQHSLSKGEDALSKEQNIPSNVTNSPLNIQRLKTENTNRDHTHRTCARENFKNLEKMLVGKSIAAEMIDLWEQHVMQKLDPAKWQGVIQSSERRNSQLESLLAFHFQNDMQLWERFCIHVKSSNFMMGGGPNGWKVTLDWILDDKNLRKVLEGNYDNPVRSGLQESSDYSYLDQLKPNPVRDAEKAAIISSIKDPVWKNWCIQLAEGVRLNELRMLHNPLPVSDLQDIANACFLECEDERLVWVGSSDQGVLNKIDNIRLDINWVYEKEYPKARTFRTRLIPESNPQLGGITHDQ